MTNSDSVGSSLLVAINKYLAKAARQEDGRYAIAVESPSQRKGPRPGVDQCSGTASFLSKYTDQDPEDGVSKRNQVWIAETQA